MLSAQVLKKSIMKIKKKYSLFYEKTLIDYERIQQHKKSYFRSFRKRRGQILLHAVRKFLNETAKIY